MSKLKYWFVRIRNKEKPDVKYRGMIIEAKCERSALFLLSTKYKQVSEYYEDKILHNKESRIEIVKFVEISKEKFDRLSRLEKKRKEKEHQEWLVNGGKEKMRRLLSLASLSTFTKEDYYL